MNKVSACKLTSVVGVPEERLARTDDPRAFWADHGNRPVKLVGRALEHALLVPLHLQQPKY